MAEFILKVSILNYELDTPNVAHDGTTIYHTLEPFEIFFKWSWNGWGVYRLSNSFLSAQISIKYFLIIKIFINEVFINSAKSFKTILMASSGF